MGKGVAWTSSNTYSSASERADTYTTIAIVHRNGTVIAFADQTFLREPYCYIEDNYQLILNIVSIISKTRIEVLEEEEIEKLEVVEKPNLPVGTVKEFTEWRDGDEHPLIWTKLSEYEVKVERPNRTTHYYFDENGSLIRWISNGLEVIYETPIPEPPYPLTMNKKWSFESNYTLIIQEEEFQGRIKGEEWVEGFQTIEAQDGEKYFCAKIIYETIDYFIMDERNITMIINGASWISSKAGLVKEELTIKYYVNGIYAGEEKIKLILKTIKKPKST